MLDELGKTNIISDKLKNLALGPGIFISDDFEFSESATIQVNRPYLTHFLSIERDFGFEM